MIAFKITSRQPENNNDNNNKGSLNSYGYGRGVQFITLDLAIVLLDDDDIRIVVVFCSRYIIVMGEKIKFSAIHKEICAFILAV